MWQYIGQYLYALEAEAEKDFQITMQNIKVKNDFDIEIEILFLQMTPAEKEKIGYWIETRYLSDK